MKPNCTECAFKSRVVECLTNEELGMLTENCAVVLCKTGELIIKEGSLSSHIAYIKSGLVKIHKVGPNGTDQILKIVTPGYYTGIQTILSDKFHRYSVTAIEDSEVCNIDITLFKELILKNPQFASELILYLCKDELSYFDRFVNHFQKHINGRLADSILYFANEIYKDDKFTLPLTRSDFATLICSTRESITRALKEFSDTKILKVDGKQIEIINKKLLEKLSHGG
jgi:CRP/FNR family transcriptional regulator